MFAWNNNGSILVMDSIERARNIAGVTSEPDIEYTDDEFFENYGLLRIIDDKVVLGLTEKEKADKRIVASYRIPYLKNLLASTDYIACKIAEGAATRQEYMKELADRQKWREEINELEKYSR